MRMQSKKIKKSAKCVITFVMTLILCMSTFTQAGGQNRMITEHYPSRKSVTEAKLEYQISHLTDPLCKGRGAGEEGGGIAGWWIQKEFERIGLEMFGRSYAKPFRFGNGKIGRNIVGMLPGSKATSRDRYIIVGAHYDHLGELNGKVYPGADANASGTAALLNLAEMFKILRDQGKIHDCNIIFVAFDAKEHSMAGSNALWRKIEYGGLKDPQSGKLITSDKISLMVNIDQIGSTLSPLKSKREDYIIMLGTQSLKPIKRDMLNICNRMFAIDMDIDLTYYGSSSFTKMFYGLSDQRIFVDNGIPAVMFTSGITMNTNKTLDKIETLDLDILKKRIFLMYHWIEKML